MPVTKRLPYQRFDTPNIRVGTHADFEVLAQRNGLTIEDSFGLHEGQVVRVMPNLRGSTAVFRFSSGGVSCVGPLPAGTIAAWSPASST